MWNNSPVDLELKDDAKPVWSQPNTVPRVHKAMYIREVQILVKLGVIKEENDSEWGAPYFSQPKAKKDKIMFLSDFRNLNRQLKRKDYTMTKIREMLLNL